MSPELPLAIIANGVIMHLCDPLNTLTSLLRLSPLSLLVSNCFECGENLRSFMDNISKRDFLIVGGSSGSGSSRDHKFAIYRENIIPLIVDSIIDGIGLECMIRRLSIRDCSAVKRYGVKMEHRAGDAIDFHDIDLNRNFSWFFASKDA